MSSLAFFVAAYRLTGLETSLLKYFQNMLILTRLKIFFSIIASTSWTPNNIFVFWKLNRERKKSSKRKNNPADEIFQNFSYFQKNLENHQKTAKCEIPLNLQWKIDEILINFMVFSLFALFRTFAFFLKISTLWNFGPAKNDI